MSPAKNGVRLGTGYGPCAKPNRTETIPPFVQRLVDSGLICVYVYSRRLERAMDACSFRSQTRIDGIRHVLGPCDNSFFSCTDFSIDGDSSH
jgi:hypothetical protein